MNFEKLFAAMQGNDLMYVVCRDVNGKVFRLMPSGQHQFASAQEIKIASKCWNR